ncbi:ABC transporter substrate-binding protein [Jingyaoa shaoxingensis]|uniref:Extracellular solute-binding protein n=1 Tax=Jingyaoa shaoxingensis TaxID=2763671 RepID=A0ABR7N8X5_9FIRM|nr:extracellular solute-binding protein [Jingyaoa shaoxingensis]MBC8572854.1 extracellular solute-binding protein [Jingyaoa shaoxingensis]
MKRKQSIMMAVAGILVAGLSAYGICHVHLRKNITLEFGMFTGSNWDVAQANSFTIIDKAIAKFEHAHPGVTVHYYSGIRKDDYSEWFSRKLLAGEEPDIFMVLGTDFNQFASMGVMKNLETFIEEDTDFEPEKYFTSAFVSGQYESVQYALPYETVPTLMFVNKTLLTQEGIDMPEENWTWEDFYEICKKVTRDTDGDGVPDQFGSYNYDWMDALCSNGGGVFNKKGTEAALTDSRVVEAVKYVRSINDLYGGEKLTQEDFNGGRVAFMPLTFAEYRTYKTYPYKIRKYANFQWDCVTMPAGEQGGNISQVDSLLMGISANTKEEKLAWEFLKLLTYDEESQMNIFYDSQGASVLKTVTESQQMEQVVQEDMEEGDTVINGKLLGRVIEEGHVEPQFKKYEQAMSLTDSEINKILEEDKDVDSNLKILQRTINEYLIQ